MSIKSFCDKIPSYALEKGFSSAEIFYQVSKTTTVKVYEGEVETFKSDESGGVCFRGIINEKMGYFFSERIDEDVIEKAVNSAMENASLIDNEDEEFIFEGGESYPEIKTYYDEVDKASTDEMVRLALENERLAKEYSPLIKSVQTSVVTKGESESLIANTKGLNQTQKSNLIYSYVSVIAQKDDSIKEEGEITLAFDMEELKTAKTSEKACQKAIRLLGAQSIETGEYKVLIDREAMSDLLACFRANFFADSVQDGFSLLKGRLGEKIASDIVYIADDALMEGGLASCAFDSEGVPAGNKLLVENGVLKSYLYNLKSAKKDGVKSTGNGFKGSFKSVVNTDSTNFYIKAGKQSVESLMAQMGEGVLITSLAGLHAGTNPITGDFSLSAQGFRIENGKMTYPIEQITVAGNFYKLLMDIEGIADDLYFSTSAIGSPTICIKTLAISGK